MMPDHTDAEELVARVIGEHIDTMTPNRPKTLQCVCREWSMPFDHLDISEAAVEHGRHRAAAVLAALAEAGLLLPAGGQTREEWMAEIDRGNGFTPSPGPAAPYICRYESDIDKYVLGIVKPTRKMRRTVHTGPWREVTP